MTREQSGRHGGLESGRRRGATVREQARIRAVAALGILPTHTGGPLADLLATGTLDPWLVILERHSYRRGYCARDERARRESADADRAALVSHARASLMEHSA